jgi:hypothetical protein
MHDRQALTRTIYSFGSPLIGQFGHAVLRPDGTIYGYQHPHERFWELAGDELRLLAWDRQVTSRYTHAGAGVWQGRWEGQQRPLYLMPALSLPPLDAVADRTTALGPAMLVNTVPKSGTYFLEAALRDVGFAPLRLHLAIRDVVFDFRDLPDEQLHVDVWNQALELPVSLVTRLLAPGEMVVGHVSSREMIHAAREQGVCVVSVVRNLRDVVASYLKFKVRRVAATSPADRFWRTLDEKQQLAGFIARFGDTDLVELLDIAKMISADPHGILVRYEELTRGVIGDDAQRKLRASYPAVFAQRLAKSLRSQLDKPNPTFSGGRTDWHQIWSEELEVYFEESGLRAANEALGYESRLRA